MNFLTRFYKYQKVRFPIAVISITSAAVVLSSAAVSLDGDLNVSENLISLIVAIVFSVLFMFHIRVIDEFRDFQFDSKYHSDRPVQKGVISLKQLMTMNVLALIVQFLFILSLSSRAMFLWFLAFGYTVISGSDFLLGNRIKRKFYLYNILNLVQLFIFQFFLYSIFDPSFSYSNISLTTHFFFATGNVVLLEFARKMKSKKGESKVKDTYSSRFGAGGSALVFVIIALISFGLFSYSMLALRSNIIVFSLSEVALILVALSAIKYTLNNNKTSEILLQGSAAIFYITTHLALAFS